MVKTSVILRIIFWITHNYLFPDQVRISNAGIPAEILEICSNYNFNCSSNCNSSDVVSQIIVFRCC
jgi:hypothetical protein